MEKKKKWNNFLVIFKPKVFCLSSLIIKFEFLSESLYKNSSAVKNIMQATGKNTLFSLQIKTTRIMYIIF